MGRWEDDVLSSGGIGWVGNDDSDWFDDEMFDDGEEEDNEP